jgi:hypothetical protein
MRYDAQNTLWQWLADNKRSVAWLARRVRCSRQFLSYLRTGERTVSEPLAQAIAFVCGGTLDEFFVPVPPTYVFDPSTLVDEREAVPA